MLAIMLPQTSCKAGDRPALMNKVMNLPLRQREGSEKEEDTGGAAVNADKYDCFWKKFITDSEAYFRYCSFFYNYSLSLHRLEVFLLVSTPTVKTVSNYSTIWCGCICE